VKEVWTTAGKREGKGSAEWEQSAKKTGKEEYDI
jgi:hypothetical protein